MMENNALGTELRTLLVWKRGAGNCQLSVILRFFLFEIKKFLNLNGDSVDMESCRFGGRIEG